MKLGSTMTEMSARDARLGTSVLVRYVFVVSYFHSLPIWSLGGEAKPDPCLKGTYSAAGSSTCTPCPSGQYADGEL